MVKLKKVDLQGTALGEVDIADDLLQIFANEQMVKDYLVAIRNNARQWSANTKGRSEVACTKAKPFPQKGQGRARQGFLAAPHYRGGGIVFGPKPKFNQNVLLNKKERRAAIRYLLAQRIKEGKAVVVSFSKKVEKTKEVAALLSALQINRRVLFLAENSQKANSEEVGKYDSLMRCMRNIPEVEFLCFPNVGGYDLALCRNLLLLEPAMEEVLAVLKGN